MVSAMPQGTTVPLCVMMISESADHLGRGELGAILFLLKTFRPRASRPHFFRGAAVGAKAPLAEEVPGVQEGSRHQRRNRGGTSATSMTSSGSKGRRAFQAGKSLPGRRLQRLQSLVRPPEGQTLPPSHLPSLSRVRNRRSTTGAETRGLGGRRSRTAIRAGTLLL